MTEPVRPPSPQKDIGCFTVPEGLLGAQLLTRVVVVDEKPPTDGGIFLLGSVQEAHQVAQQMGADLSSASYTYSNEHELLTADMRQKLIALVDSTAAPEEVDAKVVLTQSQLSILLGTAVLSTLKGRFDGTVDEIKLRRVRARGLCIPFHLDVDAARTMQVPLNAESEYRGGALVFVTTELFLHPGGAGQGNF